MAVTENTSEVIGGPLFVTLGGTTLGHTIGDGTVNIEKEVVDFFVNKTGPNVPIKSTTRGISATIDITLAQFTPEIMSVLFPEGTFAGGVFSQGNAANFDLLGSAGILVASGAGGDQWTFPAAFVTGGLAVEHKEDSTQTGLPVTFQAVLNPADIDAPDALYKLEQF